MKLHTSLTLIRTIDGLELEKVVEGKVVARHKRYGAMSLDLTREEAQKVVDGLSQWLRATAPAAGNTATRTS